VEIYLNAQPLLLRAPAHFSPALTLHGTGGGAEPPGAAGEASGKRSGRIEGGNQYAAAKRRPRVYACGANNVSGRDRALYVGICRLSQQVFKGVSTLFLCCVTLIWNAKLSDVMLLLATSAIAEKQTIKLFRKNPKFGIK
jgi:hypothetical protein